MACFYRKIQCRRISSHSTLCLSADMADHRFCGSRGCLHLFYTRRFVAVLLHIHSFLSEVASGNLNATLDHSVTKRSDELGDIGRCALSMQRSLRTMIEQDALTELYNRRSGEKSCARSSRKPNPSAILCARHRRY